MGWILFGIVMIAVALLLARGGFSRHKIENTNQRWHIW